MHLHAHRSVVSRTGRVGDDADADACGRPAQPWRFEVQWSASPFATSVRRRAAAAAATARRAVARIGDSPAATTFVAGGFGGALSRTVTAPLDRLKVLAQEGRARQWMGTHPTNHTPLRRPGDLERMAQLARYVYRYQGGTAGFWRGNGVNCLKAGPEFATAFTAREFYLGLVCGSSPGSVQPTLWQNFVVGALAGTTAQGLLYPLEVVKTRMAVAGIGEYRGIGDCFAQSLRRGGVADLYRGLAANMIGVFPHRGLEMGLFFTAQQRLERLFASRAADRAAREGRVAPLKGAAEAAVPVAVTTAVSFLVSAFSQIATYPLNLVRTRLQTQGVNGRPVRYNGMCHCFATVVAEEGVRGLFVGLAPNMLKAVPASMIMYVSFNQSKAFLGRMREEEQQQQRRERADP